MKLLDRFKGIFISLRQSLRRFPLTIGISSLLAMFLIYLNENRLDMSLTTLDKLMRFNLILGMGILLSLSIDLLRENLFKEDRGKTIISYLIGAGILAFYYAFLLNEFEFVQMTRYIGTMIFLLLVFFYIPVIGNKDRNYELRVIDLFGSFFETVIYTLVLLFGTFAILLTIDNLFDVDINYKYYLYIFILVFFVFAVSFFLSKIPAEGENFDKKQYSKSMRILLTYIVIPLISIYTLILYAYFAKILLTWEWPKGLVSHLVIWYTAVSIGVIFLVTPLIENDKISRYFKVLFPKLVLPILLMMFISIGQRIGQYGITENRYYILVLGLWITAIMVYFSVKKPLRNIIIPLSLSLIVLNSVVGPLSSYSVSKYSQNKRLNDLLAKNSMISDGSIVKNPNVSKEDQREISNIISYFNSSHDLKDIKILADDFETSQTEDTFGFKYSPNIWGFPSDEKYFYYGTDLYNNPIEIAEYDHYIQLSSWSDNRVELDDISLSKDRETFTLSIERNNDLVVEIDTRKIAQEIIDGFDIDLEYEKAQREPEEMFYELEEQGIRIKFLFTNISGAEIDKVLEFRDIEYIVFIGR